MKLACQKDNAVTVLLWALFCVTPYLNMSSKRNKAGSTVFMYISKSSDEDLELLALSHVELSSLILYMLRRAL